ncbi:hypothetical protein BJ508DRAFT_411165 [Ascobolus immersus RN42]|uniref:Extracellular membrane protein CFEM domain-containing protein n=1 Tax=Ascobolus immersus RN42 TaxID=1160509 RepID=A0A3N4IXS6_ASCIM|nr:hypothetical protein BJ508DRAFT_411165 [Ascobolus immersus RN42]
MKLLTFLPVVVLPIIAQDSPNYPDEGVLLNGPLTDLPSLINKFPLCSRPCFTDNLIAYTSKASKCRITGEPGEEIDWECVCRHAIWPFRPDDKSYDHVKLVTQQQIDGQSCYGEQEGCEVYGVGPENGLGGLDEYYDVNFGQFCVDIREDLPELPDPEIYPEEGKVGKVQTPTDLPSMTNTFPICTRNCFNLLFKNLTSKSETCVLTGEREEKVDWECVCDHVWYGQPQIMNYSFPELQEEAKAGFTTCLEGTKDRLQCEYWDEGDKDWYGSLEKYFKGNFGAYCEDPTGSEPEPTNPTNPGTNVTDPTAPVPTQIPESRAGMVNAGGALGVVLMSLCGVLLVVF